MLTIDHGESAPSHILPVLYEPVSARPQKSIRFSCCAAIPPPAALCVSIERIYSLFFNGLILYTIKLNLCQRCFGMWISICQNTAFRSYFQAHCRHGKIFTMNCRPFSGQEAIMLSKKLYRSDMINCALCHDAPCSSACGRLDPASLLRSVWFENEDTAAGALPDENPCAGCSAPCEEACVRPHQVPIRKLVTRLYEEVKPDLEVPVPEDEERLRTQMCGIPLENPFLLSSSVVAST